MKLANFELNLNNNVLNILLKKVRFEFVYLLLLIVIVVIPSSANTQLVSWEQIPLINYIRLFSALLVAFICPGLALIKLICKNELNVYAKLGFSFIISLLVLAIFGQNFFLLLFINLALLIGSIIKAFAQTNSLSLREKANYNILTISILLVAFLLFVFCLSSIYSGYWLFMGPDIWRHYGWALNIINNVSEIPLVTRGFHDVLAGLFLLSGYPSINVWIASTSFLFIPIICFYVMADAYLGKLDKRAPIVATIFWAFFSGFGWIYALFLRTTSNATWLGVLSDTLGRTNLDIGYPPGFWVVMGDNMPAAIGFASLFLLLYLIRVKNLPRKSYIFLCAVTFGAGFLIHSVEVLFVFIALVLLASLKFKPNLKDFLIAISSSTGLILVYDILYQFFYFAAFVPTQNFKIGLGVFSFSVISFIILYITAKVKRVNVLVHIKIHSIRDKISALSLALVVFLYGLSILIWLEVKDSYWWASTLPYRFVPWYFYPILMGVAGLLLIVSLIYFRNIYLKYKLTFVFLLAFFVSLLLFARVISFVNMNFFYVGFNEYRMMGIIFIPLSMIACLAIIFVFDKILPVNKGTFSKRSFAKKCAAGLLVALVILSGSLSTLMTVDYWTLHSQNNSNEVTSDELAAMDFLKKNTNPTASGKDVADYNLAFTYTEKSSELLQAFSGTGYYSAYSYKGQVLFDAQRSELPFYYFSAYHSQFIYMGKNDFNSLNSNSFMGQYLSSFP